MLMLAVIDANILVSALWSRNGSPAKVLSLVLNGKVIPCIDSRIMHEYRPFCPGQSLASQDTR